MKKTHVALTKCFFCGKSDKILLASRYYHTKEGIEPVKDLEPLHNKVVDMDPCPECASWMKKGIILLGFDPKQSKPDWNKDRIPDPYRTGQFTVVTEEAFDNIFHEKDVVDFAKKHRWIFIEEEVLKKLEVVWNGG
jgi:hypothetical protein